MGGVQIQVSTKTFREEEDSQRAFPRQLRGLVVRLVRLPVQCSGQGARRLPQRGAAALFLAFMPATQGSPKIGLGNSFRVITWDSGTSRWLLRAAPKCSQRCVLGCSLFSGFSLFFMFISGWSQSWGIHELAWSAFLSIPLFLWERKKLALQPPLSHPEGSRKLALVIVNYL